MPSTTRYAAACLAGGIGLAVGTPVYVAYAARDLAGYLLRPSLLLIQTVPFVLCGALWLPWRTPRTVAVACILATVLLVATVIVYAPMLWAPGARGGDMIGICVRGRLGGADARSAPGIGAGVAGRPTPAQSLESMRAGHHDRSTSGGSCAPPRRARGGDRLAAREVIT